MCSNYLPLTQHDRLLTYFGVEYEKNELLQREVFPTDFGVFIRLSVEGQQGGKSALIADDGRFGLLPAFATEIQYGRNTYNCRSETLHKLKSFRPAWSAGQRCIIPANAVFEPMYESGKHVRWRIFQEGNVPFGIAGIYRRWRDPKEPTKPATFTFTMLTVNCDSHPFYRRFHKSSDEKRMPIFLDPSEYIAWLVSNVDDAPKFFKQHPGPFLGEPAPMARVPRKAKEPNPNDELLPKKPPKATPPPHPPPAQGNLF